MGCGCNDKKKACDKGEFPQAVIEIKNPSQLLEFRKVVVKASLGDDTTYPPKVGMFCNTILYYEANDQVYLYSSDGIPTKITVDTEELKRQIKQVSDALADEVQNRVDADNAIWNEIETIEAASDVVDVVGTYAELQQYDTSDLHDKDLIKVLQDETRDDAITYYRWSTTTETFSYVGEEGPYYTESQIDTMMSGKQDTLIAGTNIQIASDGKTISATDTTYSPFTGATSSVAGTSGLVPAPAAGDQDKVLRGNAAWAKYPEKVILYLPDIWSPETTTAPFEFTDINDTMVYTWDDLKDNVFNLNNPGDIVLYKGMSTEYFYPVVGYGHDWLTFEVLDCESGGSGPLGDQPMIRHISIEPDENDAGRTHFIVSAVREVQNELTAGSNIQINGTTISATDTTYTAGTGISIDSNQNNKISSAIVGSISFNTANQTFTTSKTWVDLVTAINDGKYVTLMGPDIVKPSSLQYSVIGFDGMIGSGYGMYITYDSKLIITLSYSSGSGTTGTYTVTDLNATMTGATSLAAGVKGLVPAPATGDQNKFLKGDGTWGVVAATAVTVYYISNYLYSFSGTFTIYSDAACTTAVSKSDFDTSIKNGMVRLVYSPGGLHSTWTVFEYYDDLVDYGDPADEPDYVVFGRGSSYGTDYAFWRFSWVGASPALNTASYIPIRDMVGATASVAGAKGLVPAPTTSDPDHFLKGDGTWAAIPTNNISSNDWSALWQ